MDIEIRCSECNSRLSFKESARDHLRGSTSVAEVTFEVEQCEDCTRKAIDSALEDASE